MPNIRNQVALWRGGADIAYYEDAGKLTPVITPFERIQDASARDLSSTGHRRGVQRLTQVILNTRRWVETPPTFSAFRESFPGGRRR